MITGLLMTILEKEVVLGEAEAKEYVLKIVDLIEDLDLFWSLYQTRFKRSRGSL